MNRVFLRAFEPSDYVLINQWRHDEEILSKLGGNHYFVSSEREKQWVLDKSLNDNRNVYLAICLVDDRRMIGYTSLINLDLRNLKVDIGGWIIGDKKLWNKGYAKESIGLLLQYVFSEYPINKCQSYCLEEHIVSNKTHISLGFNRDGILRDDIFKHGEFKSLIVYSILREEYLARYGTQYN